MRAQSLCSIHKRIDREAGLRQLNKPKLAATGSGNSATSGCFATIPDRPASSLEADFPMLLTNLLRVEGVGIVIVSSAQKEPVCISKDGELELLSGKNTGIHPLAPCLLIEPPVLHKLATMPNAPDIQIVSSIDTLIGEVYAFEELVGNHSGIGG